MNRNKEKQDKEGVGGQAEDCTDETELGCELHRGADTHTRGYLGRFTSLKLYRCTLPPKCLISGFLL